jgi:hypothetical protein
VRRSDDDDYVKVGVRLLFEGSQQDPQRKSAIQRTDDDRN